MNYTVLHAHSFSSLLDGLSTPKQIVERLDEIGSDAGAITDHGNLGSTVQFFKEMKAAGKKPILGVEMYISEKDSFVKDYENKKCGHQVILAKNQRGWKQLLALVSESNKTENFYYRPRLDIEKLSRFVDGNLISFSGHLGSTLGNILMPNDILNVDWRWDGTEFVNKMIDMFGRENFYLEVQLIDSRVNEKMRILGEVVRELSKITEVPCVATPDAHYCRREDAIDQRVLIATSLRTTLAEATRKTDFAFFKSDNYHIPSLSDMEEFHTEEELENTNKIAEQCDVYDILSKPKLPEFKCPNNLNPDEYLRKLVAQGWRDLMTHIEPGTPEFRVYGDRVEHELEVLQGAGLSSYFLIVKDIVDYIKKQGYITGPARGSSAGCMVSYLLGITSINPITYDLLFERFYNAGRNTESNIAYPDVDVDVGKYSRNLAIDYVKEKYKNVAQLITFQTMKGRGALKRVLSAHGGITFEEQNAITYHIEDEAKIADELEEMEDASIIRWALENKREKLKDWVIINDNGNLEGPLADKFAQAIRLEGTRISQAKHPAGIVISPTRLDEICPLVLDKQAKTVCCGFEGKDAEEIGLVKLDILGIAMLDKIMGIQQILDTGEIVANV